MILSKTGPVARATRAVREKIRGLVSIVRRFGGRGFALYTLSTLGNVMIRACNIVGPLLRTCPACGWQGVAFLIFFNGSYVRSDARCPRCSALERHRGFARVLHRLGS